MKRSADAKAGSVVVELYTSEGCSSCPPADDVLGELAKTEAARDGSLVLLAFHVDYWDKLGWPDRFAKAAFTSRQRASAALLEGGRTYTPNMVVGGVESFVGSERQRAERTISAAKSAGASKEKFGAAEELRALSFRVDRAGKAGELSLDVLTPGAGGGEFLNVAVVESGLESKVTAGENAGATLKHERVVRVFESRSGAGHARVRLTLPKDLVEANVRLVVYRQDAKTRRVLAVATMALPTAGGGTAGGKGTTK